MANNRPQVWKLECTIHISITIMKEVFRVMCCSIPLWLVCGAQALRIGRGPGCRRGKTCGRGHKGQGQRNPGAIRVGFEGGQTPFYLRVPKHGFKNKLVLK